MSVTTNKKVSNGSQDVTVNNDEMFVILPNTYRVEDEKEKAKVKFAHTSVNV